MDVHDIELTAMNVVLKSHNNSEKINGYVAFRKVIIDCILKPDEILIEHNLTCLLVFICLGITHSCLQIYGFSFYIYRYTYDM